MAKLRKLTLTRAIRGHLIHCQAADFSQNTIRDYGNTFRQLLEYFDDNELRLADIQPAHIREFMAFKAEEDITSCQGVTAPYANGATRKRSSKTLRNYHTALCALWSWAVDNGYAEQHIMRQVPAPRVHQAPIQPLSDAQVVQLIRSCTQSRPWLNKPLTTTRRPTAERDRAIVALFIETAIRASELVKLEVRDIAFSNRGGQVAIRRGKGEKSRWVPFSRRCAKYLNDWLLIRDDYRDSDPLFVNVARNAGLPMTRQIVARMIKRLSKKAGLPPVTPHILRTTAACLMVRNGMTAWELQRIMGHSDVNTTMRYVRAASIDLDSAMANASPLDNLRL